jgi:exosortase/archaeosortase family protein
MTAGAHVAPRQSTVSRANLFFGLFLLATLNAFVGLALRHIEGMGFAAAALNLFGVSAILWTALAAGLSIAREGDVAEPWRRGDGLLAALVVAAALFPVSTASAVALTGASLWAIFTSPPRSPLRRSGFVFLAITGAVLWGRLILALFSGPLLAMDAIFVAGSLGVEHVGNTLWSADGATRLIVAPGCSSMQGMSLAIVFWATVNQLFRVPFTWGAVGWCAAALVATVAVNVVRIGSMLWFPGHLEALHNGWGYSLFMWLTLVLVVAIVLVGARREVFGAR